MFTTRPEILGTFGIVTSTHWLATAAGMAMLEKGGNAFDACVASGFVLQVVEPHLVGPSGEVPAVFYSAKTKKVEVLCGQGTAPKGATIAHYKSEGLKLIPGNGLLATVVPGAFDAWMLLLRDHGTAVPARGAGARHLLCRARPPAAAARVGHDQGPEGILRNRMAHLRRRLPARRRGARSPASSSATRSSPIPGSASSARRKRRAATARRRSKARATPSTRASWPRRSTPSCARRR